MKAQSLKLFKDYIADKKIVIVDFQPASRAALARTFNEFGAPMSNITIASSYDEADQLISATNPHVVIADYELGKHCGLNLLQAQRKNNPDSKNSLFIMVTGNTSQAAVSQAAEEDIDAYILKPFTPEGLRKSIMKATLEKIYPSDYLKVIADGKDKLEKGFVDNALTAFEEAQKLDKKPSLAFFYHGQAEFVKRTLSNAETDYHSGLSFNKIHYKCMIGLFDLFMEQKRNKEAYEIVRKIARYFPANPERLASVLRLAVMNKAYEDIERYYQLFCKLDQRNDELIRYVCAALVVCAKYYLQNKEITRALELFAKASATGLGRPKIVKEIILSLVRSGMQAEAERFLSKYPIELQGAHDYFVLRYAVYESSWHVGVSIKQGRDLIAQGIKDPVLYQILIERSIKGGFDEHAVQLIDDAKKFWPETAAEFEKLKQKLEKDNSSKAA